MPKGQHVRVVKPPSAKQRANISIHRKFQYTPSPETVPASSWWIGVSREELQQRIAEHAPRMKDSKFGRISRAGMVNE